MNIYIKLILNYSDKLLPPAYKIKYVDMQHIYVGMKHDYVLMR